MINPFQYNEYRRFLNDLCESTEAPRGFRAMLARAAGCQASYLSQVLKERVHLTEDQILGIAKVLGLQPPEIEYLMLLLRHEKAGTPELRQYIQSLIQKLKNEQLNLKKWLEAEPLSQRPEVLLQYFSSWVPSAVHLLTSSPHFLTTKSIATRLSLSEKKVSDTLVFLERNGFVVKNGSQWIYKSGSLHLEKDSPLQYLLQTSRRDLVQRSLAEGSAESLHFSSVFTLNEEELEQIRALMTRAIERSHKLIQASGTDRLACMCVDIFEIV